MDKSKTNYFILHGSFASPFSNWIPWLREQITNRELPIYTPDLPSGVGYQNYKNWNRLMEAYVSANLIGEQTIIFAHSIAPVFVCKFLTEHNLKVKRLIFVCGFNNYLGISSDYDAVNSSMYFNNLADVKTLCDEIICYYSDNDPYVDYKAEKDFADTIADKQIVIEDGGHLNAESGYTEFPELLNYIKEEK